MYWYKDFLLIVFLPTLQSQIDDTSEKKTGESFSKVIKQTGLNKDTGWKYVVNLDLNIVLFSTKPL